ncbi:DUF6349 family protein [Streptomyces cinereoruber]|uniref:DUF6349 family protein n=1 Tax=Streptomyces cinereoruber TaxID=67260 RepID=UPI003634E4AF
MTTTIRELAGARARQSYYWRVRNGRTRALARESASQTWHIQPGHPGGAYCDLGHELEPPAHHTPTLLSRSRSSRRRHEQEFRGGCLHCDWEGPVHRGDGYGDGDNAAIEDAHDHAFPGWRTLPSVAAGSWSRWRRLTSLYPAGWVDQGAPVLVMSRSRREAHAPPHRGRRRYELRILQPPGNPGSIPTDQEALF